jgi:hypothetical protein
VSRLHSLGHLKVATAQVALRITFSGIIADRTLNEASFKKKL